MNNWITISCNLHNLQLVRDFVTDFLSPYALSDTVHSNKKDDSKFLKLTITPKEDFLLFEITDKGKPFDLEKYTKPFLPDIIKEGKKGGVGLALVNLIMDKVEFTSENGSNFCRLSKKIETNSLSA
jgi:serine/threonine-protein kinase RsbW